MHLDGHCDDDGGDVRLVLKIVKDVMNEVWRIYVGYVIDKRC